MLAMEESTLALEILGVLIMISKQLRLVFSKYFTQSYFYSLRLIFPVIFGFGFRFGCGGNCYEEKYK